jgi:hypothetical protein
MKAMLYVWLVALIGLAATGVLYGV